jgi:excisionase family DNA binding protein
MAGTRVAQGSFEWSSPERETAEPNRVPASPQPSPPVAAKPRQSPRVRPAAANAGEHWLTADEATAYLGLPSRKALYAAVERRQVPCSRLGRRLRFRKEALDRLLLRSQSRGDQLGPRVPSPGKEPERW